MEPRIAERGPTILVGMDFYGNPFKDAPGWSMGNEIGKLWQRFERSWGQHKQSVKHVVSSRVGYEAHIGPKEGEAKDHWTVMVGVEVERIENLPLAFCARVLPAGTYAVFTLKGDAITSDWGERMFRDWLPAAGYRLAHDLLVEVYDADRFRGTDDPESELDILVPVQRA